EKHYNVHTDRVPMTGAALAAVLFLAVVAPARADDPMREEQARRTIHLLEYIAADYPGAVQDGRVVSEGEFAEQLDFAAQIRTQLTALGATGNDPLLGALAGFDAALAAH